MIEAKDAMRTKLAKFICKEIMGDDWGLGKKLCLGYADEILELTAAADVTEALTEVMTMLRKEAPGTPLNNHRFDALGVKAYAALAKAGEQ